MISEKSARETFSYSLEDLAMAVQRTECIGERVKKKMDLSSPTQTLGYFLSTELQHVSRNDNVGLLSGSPR